MKIAICDDEPLFIQQLQQMIQQLYPLPELMIDTFTAGEQLLDKIIRSQIAYQLILLDIEMDGDNGLHIARRLQQMHYEAPVVFITSHQEFALDGYEVNALRFLTKPVSPQKLLEALGVPGEILDELVDAVCKLRNQDNHQKGNYAEHNDIRRDQRQRLSHFFEKPAPVV